MSIGDNIRVCRSKIGMTQDELAKRVGITRNYISDLENDRYVPSVKTLSKIAKVLNMNLDFLTEMSEIMYK
jgi:transcriptional regulator with XRE-family HTH domain